MGEAFPGALPSGQGFDLAGTIVEIGSNVTGFVVGDDVIGWAPRRAQADYVAVLIPIPPNQGYVPYDAAGVGVGTNSDQTSEAMPGSRPGLRPTRVGPFGPTPGIRVTSNSDGSVPSSSPTQAANPLSNQPPFATSVQGQAGN